MAELAGFLARKHQEELLGRTVRIVAAAATLEDFRRVLMGLGKCRLLMTIETPAFEDESAAPAQPVALCAFNLNRRVELERLELRRRIRSDEETDLLPSSLPRQCQRMSSWRKIDSGPEDPGSEFLGCERLPVDFKLALRGGSDDAGLA